MAFDVGSQIILTAEDRTGPAIKSAMTGADRLMASYQNLFRALTAYVSVDYFYNLIKGTIDALDRMNDLSKATGIAVEQLSGLKLAAKQSGGDLESIAASINKLSVNMGKDAERFAALGITAKSPLEAFKQLANIFSAIEDPQLRAALAASALGKSWAGAAPLLSEGGDKIQEMVDKGTRLSKITKEMTEKSDELNDKWEELVGTGGALNSIVREMLDPLLRLTNQMIAARDGADGLISTMGRFFSLGGDDAKNPEKELNAVESKLVTLRKTADDFSKMGLLKRMFSADDIAIVNSQIAFLETKKDMLSGLLGAPFPKPLPLSPAEAAAKTVAAAKFIKDEGGVKDNSDAVAKKALAEYMRIRKLVEEDKALQEKAAQEVTDFKNKEIEKQIADTKVLYDKGVVDLAASVEAWEAAEVEKGKLRLKIQKDDQEKAVLSQKQQLEEWNTLWGTVESTGKQVWTIMTAGGENMAKSVGKAIKASIFDMLYQLTVRRWFINIGAGISDYAGYTSEASRAASGVGTGVGAINTGSAMYSAGSMAAGYGGYAYGLSGMASTSGVGATTAGGVMTAAPAYEAGAMTSGATYAGGTAAGSAAAGEGAAAATASSIGWTGYGLIAAAVIAAYAYFSKENPRSADLQTVGLGAGSTVGRGGFSGVLNAQYGSSGTDLWGGSLDFAMSADAVASFDSAITKVFDDAEAAAKVLGINTGALSAIQVKAVVTGQGVAADMNATLQKTADTIAQTLMPNVASLQQNGETLAQTFMRISAAMAMQRRAMDIQLLEAQGKATEALAAKREDELKAMDAALRPLQQLINVTTDWAAKLSTGVTEAVSAIDAQIGAAGTAATTAHALADSYRQITTLLRDSASKIMGSGLAITGATLQSTYGHAMSGDAAALSALPQAANDYLAASLATSRTAQDFARDQAKVVGMLLHAADVSANMTDWSEYQARLLETQGAVLVSIKTELSKTNPDTAVLEAQRTLLTTIEAMTTNTAASTAKLDQIGIKAIFDLSQVITFVANSTGIPDDLRALITAQGKDYLVKLQAALDPGVSDTLRNMLITGAGNFNAVVMASFASADKESRILALTGAGTYLATVSAQLGTVDPYAQRLAFGTANSLIGTVYGALGSSDQTALRLAVGGMSTLDAVVAAQLASDAATAAVSGLLNGTASAKLTVYLELNAASAQATAQAAQDLVNSNAGSQSLSSSVATATAAYLSQQSNVDAAMQTLQGRIGPWGLGQTAENILTGQASTFVWDHRDEAQNPLIQDAIDAYTAAFAEEYRLWKAIPAHAAGGLAQGWSLVGEQGPELANFSQPGRIYTAAETRAALSGGNGSSANDELVAEVRGLRAENSLMRADIRQMKNTLVRVTRDGDGMVIATDTEIPVTVVV